jgi:isopenicillin-N N-acyltransferase-like protein
MRRIRLDGTAARMGEAFGEAFRDAVAELYALRLANALRDAHRYGRPAARESDLLELAAACLVVHERVHPAGATELRGIARGAGLTPEEVMALGGLTDLRDGLAWGGALEATGGCTAFLAPGEASADGHPRSGQTWDLATDNAPFVVAVERHPTDGLATWCITAVGCLSLMGMNEAGLAVGTTNLRTRDAGVGVPYLGLLQRALEERDAPAAAAAILAAPRAGAHFYSLLDAAGNARAVECTGQLAAELRLADEPHVQCNHCQVPAHQALEADTPRASSEARWNRMQTLLDARRGSLDEAYLKACLADEQGGPLAIRRNDFDGISTHAAIVTDPSAGTFAACAGLPPREGTEAAAGEGWIRFGPGACGSSG